MYRCHQDCLVHHIDVEAELPPIKGFSFTLDMGEGRPLLT